MKAIKRIGFALISLIVVLFVAAPLFAVANSNVNTPTYNVKSVDKTFKCQAYTRNTVQSNGELTDNQPKFSVTTIREDKDGFTIEAGDAFSEKLVLGNGLMGYGSNMGTDNHTILMKRNEVPGALYFIVYTFTDDKKAEERPKDSPIQNLIVVAQCKRTQ
jgi:hypothetical protein